FEDRSPAPAVHRKLDVAPGCGFWREGPVGPQRFEIRAERRDEGQRTVVEHHAHDDAADDAAIGTDALAGPQDVTLARSERRHFVERLLPGAARRAVAGFGVLGEAQREPAHEAAAAIVELDRRRQT